jgi:hypothetical protein
VQHVLARANGAPHHFAQVLVHRDQTWGARRRSIAAAPRVFRHAVL